MNAAHQHLQSALDLAKKSAGNCAPNPAVGAVITKNNQIIAQGWHKGPGKPHAEVEAINNLNGESTKNCILYVTLEPCCHHGRTPPCTELIAEHNFKKVIYGFADPNPQVAGKGAAFLQEHGIDCEQIDIPAINHFYNAYQHWWKTKTPWAIAKIALSLDGKIAGPNGEPVAITGPELAVFTHEQRKNSDALLTTVKTIINDNPSFNVRLDGQVEAKPLHILDSRLEIPLTAKVFKTTTQLTIFHSAKADAAKLKQLQDAGTLCVTIEEQNHQLNLSQAIKFIGEQGMHQLWIEVGGTCFESFMHENLLNQAYFYVGGKTLGKNALSAFEDNFLIDKYSNNNWQSFGQDKMLSIVF